VLRVVVLLASDAGSPADGPGFFMTVGYSGGREAAEIWECISLFFFFSDNDGLQFRVMKMFRIKTLCEYNKSFGGWMDETGADDEDDDDDEHAGWFRHPCDCARPFSKRSSRIISVGPKQRPALTKQLLGHNKKNE
jgi:hypothetical protein